ncbi:MAG: methyltransferase domain-containing protein [Cyanobacteria bacterium]|jgi:ubiquinone/menaquinone biosynthesis C-methylase UbiE|nr:methyltransferase domain-containing protein [Cyanobacteria bacterium GSL.Bin1]
MSDPIQLLFEGLENLAPGDDASTEYALNLLPHHNFELIVDVGCGTGRHTLVLAEKLRTLIHAIDLYEFFLSDLMKKARSRHLQSFIQTHCMDMNEIPKTFQNIDLLWSEGSAYAIGFRHALNTWAKVIAPEGFLVVSELSWLTETKPDRAQAFFQSDYPAMQSVQENLAVCENAGYDILHTYTLPRRAWEQYYNPLQSRAQALQSHEDPSVQELAQGMLEEIAVFEESGNSYGYVFFILQRSA